MSVPVSSIHRLLRSPEVHGINFSYPEPFSNGRTINRTVTGQKFNELSRLFSDTTIPHRIRVTTNPAIVRIDSEATYDQYEDKINVRSDTILQTPEGRACFVHECVHALQDWRYFDMRIQLAESMAYIAEAWYLLNSPAGSLNGICRDLRAVSRELRESYGRQIHGSPVEMTSEQYHRAREAVVNCHHYHTGFYDYNGIRGNRRRT